MGISIDTAHKLLTAVESLATSAKGLERRAVMASHSLIGISAEDFPEGRRTYWNYVSANSASIHAGSASEQVVKKYVGSIWQLFEACRPKH